MKSILFIFSVVARIQAHTLFQKVSVNGVDQGDLTGVRVPDSNFVRTKPTTEASLTRLNSQ